MPNKANGQDSLLVEVTARLKLSIDNTWELVSFIGDTAQIVKEDTTKQKRLQGWTWEPKPEEPNPNLKGLSIIALRGI